ILESLYLKVLLGFKDIDRSARGLAKTLKEDEEKILKALKSLQQRGLVEEQKTSKGTTRWATDAQYTIFKDDHTNEMLAKFHRQSFLKAIAAQRLPKGTRRFDALVLPLSPKDYANMAKEFETFLDHLFYKYNVDELKGKSLYQIQIGTFPAI
ncbi:MAG: DUF4423 domain-containing protein, partial [Bdellovibrio sp.]|nr:DUF4423 domain-containing protein [Bdellovibrio sp.]